MNITFASAYEDPEIFKSFTKDYIKTLSRFDKKLVWTNPLHERLFNNTNLIELDHTPIGFVTSRLADIEGHNPMLLIENFYIAPKYRRKGYGREAVRALVRNWGGYIFLYILIRNMGAKSFWAEVERLAGWYRIEYPSVPERSGYDLRVYKQNMNKKGGNA